MKINCEKCQAKYSIADEKVRGKTFKIRCKKCGHVIIVRDKGAAAAGSGADAAPAAASAPEPAGWHVAVGGETIGPLSEHDIRARIEQGEYRQDASVWRDGFEDWVPMHTIEEFRLVLERFSEDGASSSSSPAMGGSASPDLGGTGSGGTPQSPRVQSLTGQRNENSVLFSLDSLQKVGSGAQATGTASSGAAAATLSPGLSQPAEPLGGPGGTFTPSTAAPTSEGSGLIDIRAMSQVLSSQGAAEAKRDDNVLPSFGGSGLGGLSAQPVAVEEPLPVVQDRGVAPAPVQSKSNVGLILAATLGSVGLVLGLGYFFVVEPMMAKGASDAEALNKAQLAVVEERAKFAEQELERARKEQEAALEQAKKDAQAAEAAGAAGRPPQPAAAGNAGGGRTPNKRGEGRRRPGASAGAAKKPAAGGAAPKPEPNGEVPAPSKKKAGGSDGNIDVDCLLDPNLPKCKKSGGRKPKKSGGGGAAPKASADPNLPASLTQAQLLGGLRLAKTRAKGCGKKNGAAAGTRVRVRMSISGSTGKVTSAVPQGEHVGTPLGKCVAAAASKATFPKFKKSSQGLQYNFKM